jgi:predicted adenine nucleotide alpha hydrolase (AANH) superfamily ATPase/N-acetylmuramoyl-L-alanine amidase
MNYQKKLDTMIENIIGGDSVPKLLLHACCAPCSTYCIEYLSNYFDITIYYYNPNIEPAEEFDKRAIEIKKFIETFKTKNPVKCVIEHYDSNEYEQAIKGHEEEPEGSNRCFICYKLRMQAAAMHAKEHDFDYFTTTLSISPYKNSNKLNEIGEQLEKDLGVKYLYADFKKKNGYKRSVELSNEYKLYRQDYCGCKYSKIAKEKRDLEKGQRNILEQEKNIEEVNTSEVRRDIADLYENSYNKTVIKKKKRDKDPEMFKFHDIKKRDTKRISLFKVLWSLTKVFLTLGVLLTICYLLYKVFLKNNEVLIPTEKTKANINELYIYGNHLNMKGDFHTDLSNITDVNLVMVGTDNNIEYDLKYKKEKNGEYSFYITDSLNTGFLLDNMMIDRYVVFVKVVADHKTLYYSLNNKTSYKKTNYYGITKKEVSKKITISNEFKYHSMSISVSKSTDEVYDIIIDPGHGGSDSGACYNNKCETDYTLLLSKILKKDLEKKGFKVALTRSKNIRLDKYGGDGRVTKAYESYAKMLISIHLNSSDVTQNGFEFYTSNHINYDFAREVVSSLKGVSDFTYSYNNFKKIENGIYTRTFDKVDIDNTNKDAEDKKYEPFKVSNDTNYYFMIRETGGYMAGAYVDGRDGGSANPYVKSNRGIESYILELGYITSQTDLDYIDKYKEQFMAKLSETITSHYNK